MGKGAASAACSRNTQCSSGYCTSTETLQCPGACQDRVAAGGDCMNIQECVDGLTCPATAPRKCAAYATENAACLMDDDCRYDLRCRSSTCQTPPPGTMVCSESRNCAAGKVCVASTCHAIVGAGDSCTTGNFDDSTCAAGFWCDANNNKCAALPTLNGDCTNAKACTGSYCDTIGTKTCKAYLNIGDTCGQNEECASQLCASFKCAAPGEFYCSGA